MAQYPPQSAEKQKHGVSNVHTTFFFPLSFYCGDPQKSQRSLMMLLISITVCMTPSTSARAVSLSQT